jgi:hypothetical protein
LPSRSLLAAALLAAACGQKSGTKTTGTTGDDGAAPPPGQEAGPPGSRGGGGAFGGGDDRDAAAASDGAAEPSDAPGPAVDATPASDLARDLARDTHLTPVDAVTIADLASADSSTGSCASTCDMLESDYKAALVRARMCNPVSKLQCQMSAATGLGCAGCKVWVNSTVELADVRAKWIAAGCNTCQKVVCPQIACRALTTGVCHSKMLAAQDPPGDRILPQPTIIGTCIDQSDPVPF